MSETEAGRVSVWCETVTPGVCASEVCKGVRLNVCSWEGVRGEVGKPE